MKYKHKAYLARNFRKNSTDAEEIFWQAIRSRKFMNLKFRRQYIILNYIIDFYCPKLKLAIEIDGKIHEKQEIRDRLREELIKKKKDIRFIRIKNEEIEKRVKEVLNNIKEFINKTHKISTPPSPVTGEGGRGDEV